MDTRKQQTTIQSLYLLLIASTVMSFMPNIAVSLFGLLLLLIVLIAAYLYRLSDARDGLLHNHMTYMIGTIWLGSTLIALGVAMAGWWVYMNGDHSVVQSAVSSVQTGLVPSEDQMYGFLWQYMADNRKIIMDSALMFVAIPVLYFLYRVVNGFARAASGYRVANPKSWL